MEIFLTVIIGAIGTYLLCIFIEVIILKGKIKGKGPKPCLYCGERVFSEWDLVEQGCANSYECRKYQKWLKVKKKPEEPKSEEKKIKSKKKKMKIAKIYRIIIWAIVVKLLWSLTEILIN